MAARLAMRTYDCRSRTPRFLASRVSPLIAACKSFASVGKVMSLGCTVVSTVIRAKSFVRSAPLSCATRKLSARRSSSLPPRRLRQWLRSEQLVRKLVLQELLSGEVLEVWIIDPAFAHAFVGQSVNMLEQKKARSETVSQFQAGLRSRFPRWRASSGTRWIKSQFSLPALGAQYR